MKIRFSDKIQMAILGLLQVFIFYFWYQSVIKNGIVVFNNVSISDSWFLPVAVFLFLILNSIFAFLFFQKNYFLKIFFIFFSFLVTVLELIILTYYIIIV